MSFIFRILLFAAAAFLFSCGNSSHKEISATDSLLFSNDAEYNADWINQEQLTDFPKAHSGSRVSITDTTNKYSLGFRKKIKDISNENILSVSFSAWLYVDSLADLKGLTLVASIDDSSKNIFWYGADLQKEINKAGEWIEVKGDVSLNPIADPEAVFTGYVLNNTGSKVLVDDVEFRFLTKWPADHK